MNSTEKLIFVLTVHNVLGVLIEPFMVSVHDNSQFLYGLKKVNASNVGDYSTKLQDSEKSALIIIDEYREENLVKQFCKKRIVPKEFYKEITDERFHKIIRPWIEKRIVNCLDILSLSGIPVYFRGKKKDPLAETKILINKCKAEIILNFEKLENETRYYLTPACENKEIILFHETSLLITRKPCYAFLGRAIYKFNPGFDGNKLLPFFRKEFIVIPGKNEKEFYKTFVTNAILDHRIRHSGFEIENRTEELKPVLKLENTLDRNPALALYFNYGKEQIISPFQKNKLVSLVSETPFKFVITERDLVKEESVKSALLNAGLKNTNGNFYHVNQETGEFNPYYHLFEWVNKNHSIIEQNNIEIINQTGYFFGKINVTVELVEGNDWFDIMAVVKFGDFIVPVLQLKKYILNNIREYPLPDGSIAFLPEEWFSRFREVLMLGGKEGTAIRIKKHQFALLEKINLSENQKYQKVFEHLRLKNLKINYTQPRGLTASLRPYQEKGFSWLYFLYKNNLGGCLADDMGLGKTIQVLALLLKIKEEAFAGEKIFFSGNLQLSLFEGEDNHPPAQTSLIVMPLSLVYNWEGEIRKFAPSLRYFKQVGTNRIQTNSEFYNYDVILTTYGIIRNDLELFREVQFNYIILDESQFIKNPESKAFSAIKSLNSEHRIVLTGTPVENSLTDLWSQFSFINPGLLGSLSYFKNEYVIPIEKQNSEAIKENLKQQIEPFILRRTKKVVAKELPDLIEKVHYCEMLPEQKSLYETKKSEIRNRIFENMEGLNQPGIKIEILQALMQLRLLANHPELTSTGTSIDSGKFDEVIRNIENLMAEGHKVLIFSQFVKHLNIFRNWFDKHQITYSYLTGELNDKIRKLVIQEFQSNKQNQLFLISLKAGGVGLNLTSADYVFILDPWWNPSVEKQAISRAHRIGQTKNVISYKFITKDTIEEKILNLQQRKEKLVTDFINSNNPFKNFSEKEIKELFD